MRHDAVRNCRLILTSCNSTILGQYEKKYFQVKSAERNMTGSVPTLSISCKGRHLLKYIVFLSADLTFQINCNSSTLKLSKIYVLQIVQ